MRIALIMSDNPYAPNGAAGYMKCLYESRELAVRYGIDEVAFCHGGVSFTDPERYVMSFKGKAKQAVKRVLVKTRWGTRAAIKATSYRRGENAIAMYDALQSLPDVIVFNDFATHDLFLQRHPDYDGLIIQILHGNGEFGRMMVLSMPKIDPGWVKSIEEKIIADSDIIVHVGAKNKNLFDKLHPECVEKSVHIHTGISDMGQNSSERPGDTITFVCVGTICDRKNQASLLEVAQDEGIRSRCRFVVVGGGPEYESCKARAANLGLSEVVNYVGPSSRVVDYYHAADAFISVSADEGLPTVALEAMSCGLPLLLTDAGGCAELINGNGVLIPTCDIPDIIAGIKKFLALFDAGKISGDASRGLYESRYTVEAMWREWAEFICDRLAAKAGNARG